MNSKVHLKNKALELRKQGKSYNEIMKELEIAKSTLSGWLKHLPLSDEQKNLVVGRSHYRISRGRLNASISNRSKRIVRENSAFDEAKREFEEYIKEPFFHTGIALYWAEGAKRNPYFQFINSDPAMIILMARWIRKYMNSFSNLLKFRLYIHEPYRHEDCEGFWSSILGISRENFKKTSYKPTSHAFKKNPNYKGCLSMSITRIDALRKVKTWQKLLIQYYSNAS